MTILQEIIDATDMLKMAGFNRFDCTLSRDKSLALTIEMGGSLPKIVYDVELWISNEQIGIMVEGKH